MKKKFLTVIGLLTSILLLTPLLASKAAWAECLSIAVDGVEYTTPPEQIFFGDVAVDTVKTVTITLTNVVCSDGFRSEVTVGSVTAGPNPFSIEEGAPPPLVILPVGSSMDINLYFSPTEVGEFAGRLTIVSNAVPPFDLLYVPLVGTGTVTNNPGELMADLLTFFDASVIDGSLFGSGLGRSALHRLKALNNMLKASSDLIEAYAYDLACTQLQDALHRTDGLTPPPDFVAGENADNLASMIIGVRNALGCP